MTVMDERQRAGRRSTGCEVSHYTMLRSVTKEGTIVTYMVTDHRADRMARLLFGSVRRDVLALLYGRPDERFYLREIQRAVGAGIGPVQRELKQLADAGLVERERRGQHVYFTANRAAPIFSELQAIVEKTSGAAEVLRASLGPLLASGRIEAAFVYGSVAEGAQTARSDVDLFVLGDVALADVVPALRDAQSRLGREVNPSIYSRRDLRAKVKAGSAFLRRVLSGPKLMIAGDRRGVERLAR
jgi:predicted nucleotidyltransferase/predicted transcriptional regulator